MAGLMRTKAGFYIARTHLPRGSHPSEVKTPLMTKDYKTALIRKLDVEAKADEIKAGIKFSFIWAGNEPEIKVVHFTLKDARDKYVSARKADMLADSTITIIENALDHLQKVLRPSFPIETFGLKQIDAFRINCLEEKYSKTTINIRLRNIKTFLIWLHERSHIKQVPKIKMLPVPKTIRYLSNSQFDDICKKVTPFMQRVLTFYRETGCRLQEPFLGELDGNFLTITAEHSKGRRQRDVFLTDESKSTLLELRKVTHLSGNQHPGRSKDSPGFRILRDTHEVKFYSKEFKTAAVACGLDHARFHDLRHTAALRAYLKTRDIYAVARLLGHASVNTTQIYANFDLKRLEQDFPDLVHNPDLRSLRQLEPKLALSS